MKISFFLRVKQINKWGYIIKQVILGDPGAASGGEGKSKRAEK